MDRLRLSCWESEMIVVIRELGLVRQVPLPLEQTDIGFTGLPNGN